MAYMHPGPDHCRVCARATTDCDGSLVRLCACSLVHPTCLTHYRALNARTIDEVFCTACEELHRLLPTHLAMDERRGHDHLALVELRLPHTRPTLAAVTSGARGAAALQALAREAGTDPAAEPTVICQIVSAHGTRHVRLRGWDHWSWGVYCIAVTQARRGLGTHAVELAVHAPSANFSLV